MRIAPIPHFNADEATGTVTVDLHGYTVETAREVVAQKVQEAFLNGFKHITLIHGASSAGQPPLESGYGYGVIKWELRRTFQNGEWSQWLYSRRHKEHTIGHTSMTLCVRPNPSPQRPPVWQLLPEADYQ